ncbi:MAG: hypothetical protein JW995_11165 [Melioribacteraceae bacterium]|nr:hypothetical protein [Melioribacteraceae bacterium]
MPLKNPDEIPKIPKTRKKKAGAAIEAIPEKKPDKLEYKCRAFFRYDKALREQKFVFRIETIAEFTSFAYEIAVDDLREKREFFFVLMGLKAKPNIIPLVQSAYTDLEYKDLVGEYKVNVVKQDGAINSAVFKFNLFSKEIILVDQFIPKKKNNRLFCEFGTAEELYAFSP